MTDAAPPGAPALAVAGLQVTYAGPPPVRALDGLSLDVAMGECVGVLGESGSGKSTLAKALLGLASGAVVEGGLHLGGVDLGGLDETGWQAVRWRRIALAVQSTSSLNPVLRIGLQLAEPQMVHLGRTRAEADERSAAVPAEVGLDGEALDRYPNELSGGQRRLVLLAMALVCDPSVVVLDEPTAGLDPSTRARVVDLLRRLREERRVALVISATTWKRWRWWPIGWRCSTGAGWPRSAPPGVCSTRLGRRIRGPCSTPA